jgi:hypothetical protein
MVAAEKDQAAGGVGLVVEPKQSAEIETVSPATSVKLEVRRSLWWF